MVTNKFQAQVKKKQKNTTYTSKKIHVMVMVTCSLTNQLQCMKITKITVDCFN